MEGGPDGNPGPDASGRAAQREGRGRLGVAREPVRATRSRSRSRCCQSDDEQLGLEDVEQQDLRRHQHRRHGRAAVCRARSRRLVWQVGCAGDCRSVLGARIAQGNRNNLEDFEQQGFIKAVTGNRVEFDYDGIYKCVVDTVTRGRRRLDVPAAVAAIRCAVECRVCRWRLSARPGRTLHRQAEVEDRGRPGAGERRTASKIDASEPTRFSDHRRRWARPALRVRSPETARHARRPHDPPAQPRRVRQFGRDRRHRRRAAGGAWSPIRLTICGAVEAGRRRRGR